MNRTDLEKRRRLNAEFPDQVEYPDPILTLPLSMDSTAEPLREDYVQDTEGTEYLFSMSLDAHNTRGDPNETYTEHVEGAEHDRYTSLDTQIRRYGSTQSAADDGTESTTTLDEDDDAVVHEMERHYVSSTDYTTGLLADVPDSVLEYTMF